jgi:hypothetical protein
MSQVALVRAGDAEVFVYPQEPDSDDASDMYVLDVLGVTVLVRLVAEEDEDDEGNPVRRVRPKIMVEAGGVFSVGVNDDVNVYGEES